MLNWPKPLAGESIEDSVARVHRWVQDIFVRVEDIEEYLTLDHHPLRSELEENAERHGGVVHDDCDGYVALCRCALWDLGVQSRILVCNVEPTGAAPTNGGNHEVLTPEGTGMCMDQRYSVVVSRTELERIGYQWIAMSGLRPGDPYTEVLSP